VTRDGERVESERSGRGRRLHKAFLRYHDPANWPLLREALNRMGRADLIGWGKRHLVPPVQPVHGTEGRVSRPLAARRTAPRRAPIKRRDGSDPR
jgi:hypothetical protein